jgi:hypothetical protein
MIELLFSGVVIVVRGRRDFKFKLEKTNSNLERAIRTLVVSGLFPVLGLICEMCGFFRSFLIFTEIGIFILWPISAVLTILGKGVGRRLLLGGHGTIASFLFAIFWSVRSHGLTFPHLP